MYVWFLIWWIHWKSVTKVASLEKGHQMVLRQNGEWLNFFVTGYFFSLISSFLAVCLKIPLEEFFLVNSHMGLDRRCLRAKSLLSFEVSFKAALQLVCCSTQTHSSSATGTLHISLSGTCRQTTSMPLGPALLTHLEQAVGSKDVYSSWYPISYTVGYQMLQKKVHD